MEDTPECPLVGPEGARQDVLAPRLLSSSPDQPLRAGDLSSPVDRVKSPGTGLSWMDALSAVATTPAPALREKSSSSPDVSRDKRSKKTKEELDEKAILRESRRTPFASQGTLKASDFDASISFKEIIDLKREEDIPRALRVWLERNDVMRKGSDGWTPLHEACNAHNIPLVVELLRAKASGTARSNDGNIPLHYLMKAPLPKGPVEPMTTTYSVALQHYMKHSPKSALDAENDRGETPLYRAAQVGNYVLVSLLLQHGADPFLAFIPEDRLSSQRDHWLRTQEVVSSMKALVIKRRQEGTVNKNKNSRVSSLFGRSAHISPMVVNVRKMTTGPELLRQSYLDAMKTPSGSKRSLSSPMDQMLLAIVADAFAPRTLEVVHKLFYSAWKASDTWSPMQAMQLSIDRITALKEERGRYYIGFAHNNEVLAALRDSFTLVNCSDTPLRWEIFRYYPELSTYNADTLRFEVVGKRRGLLAPGAQEKLQVSLLATSACEFAQLVGIQYFEDVPGSEPRAAYFFLASSMKPPKDLEDLEVDSALLPCLDHCLGIGGSASVYKVANFLPLQADSTHLAVKKFQYNLGGGLEEHSEDYRRFKLELYISSKMNHPNVVRTYGFTGHPPCLIMEFVDRNLRDLIDDKNTTLSLPIQMKVALHIAKGMAYLHSFNVIHRDLKPANILINAVYDAKVADFGISLADKILDAKLRSNAKEEVQGTQFYMAPELILGDKNYSIESDVYSYGLILYEVLKRTNLVDDLALGNMSRVDFMRMRATGAQPVAKIEGLDSTMKDLIENCWATKPQARYPFTSVVTILTEHRKRCLHLDLDQEFEEAAAEGQVHTVLESWNKRIFAADEKVAQQFRDHFVESKALKRILSSLLDAKGCSDEEAMEIAALFEHTIGPDAGELVANLRSLVPVLAGLGEQAARAQAYLLAALPQALTSKRDATADGEGLAAWLELVVGVSKDSRLRDLVTTNRFIAERQALERRLAELKAETKKVKRRLQRLQEAPNSLEFVSGFLQLNVRDCSSADALLDKLEADIGYLEQQLFNTFEPSEIRKLRQRDNREARIAIALYDSHALAVRHAQDQLSALAMVFRDEPRLASVRARLHTLLATVSAAQAAPV